MERERLISAHGGPDFEALAQELEEQARLLEARLASGGWNINDWTSAVRVYARRAAPAAAALRRARSLEKEATEALIAKRAQWNAELAEREADVAKRVERAAEEAWWAEREKLVADNNALHARLAESESKRVGEVEALRREIDVAVARVQAEQEQVDRRKFEEELSAARAQMVAAREQAQKLLGLLMRAEPVLAESDAEDIWREARAALRISAGMEISATAPPGDAAAL